MQKKSFIKTLKKKKDLLLCALSGAATALCYHFAPVWFLCFFTPVPFLYLLIKRELTVKKQFSYTFSFSFFFYAVSMVWIFELRYAIDMKISAEMAYGVLFLALLAISMIESAIMSIAMMLFPKIKQKKPIDAVLLAGLYILGEFFMEYMGTLSFPWCRLANIAAGGLWFVQSASLLGGLFVSALVVIISAFIAMALVNRKYKKKAVLCFTLAVAVFTVNSLYGILRMQVPVKEEKSSEVLMVQGNYPNQSKWNSTNKEMLDAYLALSEKGITDRTRLVIWPETALPFTLDDYDYYLDLLKAFVKERHVTLVFGAFDEKTDVQPTEHYNSMFVLYPDGTLSQPYYKQLLVPMGEYVPLEGLMRKLLPVLFEKKVLEWSVGIGSESKVYDTQAGKLSGLICYESILPQLTREHVRNGSELLAMIANDSWFGESIALKQHYSHSILRAIENNRYILRTTNTGITGVINQYGQTVSEKLPISISGTVRAQVTSLSSTTLYTKIGDMIILPVLLLLLYSFSKKITNNRKISGDIIRKK